MMKPPTKPATLRADEIACLHALRSGNDTLTTIAVAAHLTLKQADAVLKGLCVKDLVLRASNGRNWMLTEQGRNFAERKNHSWNAAQLPRIRKIGAGAQRLLDLLDRPMRGEEVAEQLNLSRQRVHQLVVKLLALGRLRVGDPKRVTFIVARSDDRSVLLSYKAERVLSSLPRTEETIASYVATDLTMPLAEVLEQLSWLADQGLVRETGPSSNGPHYALTEAGAIHGQYQPDATKARPIPLPVRSDRVLEVLSHLADHGPVRIRDLRDKLHIEHTSMNALAQYLKRKGLIRKTDKSLHAAVELTTDDVQTQRAMVRRKVQEA